MTVQILVTGRMGSGKDVFADYLVDQHNFVKTAFADGIRRIIREYDPTYKLKSDRQKEIEVGNSFRRWFGDDFWINEALCRLREGWYDQLEAARWSLDPSEHGPRSVISDGRFHLEYEECVTKRGFIHIHIDADGDVRKKRLLARDGKFNEEHFYSPDDCQIPLSKDTLVIANNSSLTEFHSKIDGLLSLLQKEVSI